jgi:hypothetical protein
VGISIDADRIRWLDAEREVALADDTQAGPGAGMGGVTADELEGPG